MEATRMLILTTFWGKETIKKLVQCEVDGVESKSEVIENK